jgi:hypothetical protein
MQVFPSHRTINGPESFHSDFNDQFYSAHPCIYVFIDVLKQIQTTTYIKIRGLDNPATVRRTEKEKLIDLRMFKNVYKSSTKILQIGFCRKFQPHWLHVSCSRNFFNCPLLLYFKSKWAQILTSSNEQSKFHPPFFLFLAWWPSWLEVGITEHKFGRGPSKDHSTKVWLQLAQWFLRRRFLCEYSIGSYVRLSSALGPLPNLCPAFQTSDQDGHHSRA